MDDLVCIYDDTIPIMIGTDEDVYRAVKAFEAIHNMIKYIELFHGANKHTTIEDMVILKGHISKHYNNYKQLSTKNVAYDWLFLTNDVERVIYDYENKLSVAGWFKDASVLSSSGLHTQFHRHLLYACKTGNLNVVKWLNSIGVDIQLYDGLAFNYACLYGYENIVKLMCELGIRDSIRNEGFTSACIRGKLDVAKYIYSVGGIDIHRRNDKTFLLACSGGFELTAKWLYSLGGVNIHAKDDWAFMKACENGHESVAHWLHELGAPIHSKARDYGYHKSNENGYKHISNWILHIGPVRL